MRFRISAVVAVAWVAAALSGIALAQADDSRAFCRELLTPFWLSETISYARCPVCRRRKTRGELPMMRRKVREKWLWS
jgi:hypothetical protein